jgi:hypothetical protein
LFYAGETITKGFGFGHCKIALWCLPKSVDAATPKGYPKLTYPIVCKTLSTTKTTIGPPAKEIRPSKYA